MRPSYKPIKRRESKAFALRRQTLKQKKGDDETFNESIENIDDYWKVASQKLAIDSTLTECSIVNNQLFSDINENNYDQNKQIQTNAPSFYSKSFKNEFEEEIQKVNVSGISDSVECVFDKKINNENTKMSDESNFDNNDFDMCELSESKIQEDVEKRSDDTDEKTIINKKEEKINAKKDNYHVKKMVQSRKSKGITNNKNTDNKKIEYISKDTLNKNSKDINKIGKNTLMNIKDKNKISKDKTNSKTKENVYANDTSSFIKNQNNCLFIGDIQKIERNKNQMNFLIETDAIETGIIFLNDSAFVEEIVADKSFSLLVLKGAVNVKIEDELFCLKKHGMTVVGKNKVYSIQGIEGYNSSIFISYSLK